MAESSRVRPQIVAGFLATLTGLTVGLGYAWSAPALPKLLEEDSDLRLTSGEGAWIVSALTLGSAFGPVISALLVDRIGRKWSLHLTAAPSLLCWIFTALATSYEWLYAARLIGGIGIGASFAIVPIYLGEIAESKVRGGLGALLVAMQAVGNLMTYAVGPWVSRQVLAVVSAGPTLIFAVTFIWMPESPYYLLMRNRTVEAGRSLAWLRGTQDVKEELRSMQEQVESERGKMGEFLEIVTVPGNRKALVIILGLLTAQQFSGTVPILSYSTLIFAQSASTMDPDVSVFIVGVVTLVFSLVAVGLVDSAGRRLLLILSVIGTTICLLFLAVYFHLQAAEYDVSAISWFPLMSIILFNVPYSVGIGSLPSAVLSEIFATNVKAWAIMVASTYGSLLAMGLSKVFQVISDEWGVHVIFYALAIAEIASLVWMVYAVPETKGKTLKEIQDILHKAGTP